MGIFDDIMAFDAAAFVDSDALGETVTYTPRNGTAVEIKATILRNEPEPLESNAQTLRYGKSINIEAFIRNHATLGRTSIDTGGDTITTSARYGGETKTYHVASVLDQDAGMWRLRLR